MYKIHVQYLMSNENLLYVLNCFVQLLNMLRSKYTFLNTSCESKQYVTKMLPIKGILKVNYCIEYLHINNLPFHFNYANYKTTLTFYVYNKIVTNILPSFYDPRPVHKALRTTYVA